MSIGLKYIFGQFYNIIVKTVSVFYEKYIKDTDFNISLTTSLHLALKSDGTIVIINLL